ncbi:serine hydrolase domain-containing protein [Streptomyces sp. NPDC102279]|uniref:serine hydrolase domain-containing protein n=1 Tax=Streptomyces sp. NPDC102279 TaxID=3366153 RepID=UPI003802D354
MRDELQRRLDSGAECGASIAVIERGELVVDLWGGHADAARTRPWERDTLTPVWSTTKTMTALVALMLVDRGELDLDRPVAHYWPEFGANGKQDIKVRHLLSHSSGVSAWEQPVTVEDVYDWEKSTAMLAAQAPWWEPGTASGYHALNLGHLVGEVVRRVTGRRLKAFFAEEVAGPLEADFFIGLPTEHHHRVAEIIPPPPRPSSFVPLPGSVQERNMRGPAVGAQVSNTEEWRRADIGAANGHGNARSVATIQSVISHGGEAHGAKLLSQSTIDLIFDEQTNGRDHVLGVPVRFGVGYALPLPSLLPYVPEGRLCFWGGLGGSLVVNDLDRGVTMAYMMNRLQSGVIGSENSAAYFSAYYAARSN